MEAQKPREGESVLGPGMLGCDREVFAQVWSRVAPGENSPVEVAAAAPEAPRAAEAPLKSGPLAVQGPVSLGEDDQEGRRLQELIRAALADAATYQRLTQRSRRARQELQELARRKTRQAKRLSAAYFLLTGVRYWPQGAVPAEPPESFFPVLRQQFLSEGRRREALNAACDEVADPFLKELYLSLSEEAAELGYTIRLIVERET